MLIRETLRLQLKRRWPSLLLPASTIAVLAAAFTAFTAFWLAWSDHTRTMLAEAGFKRVTLSAGHRPEPIRFETVSDLRRQFPGRVVPELTYPLEFETADGQFKPCLASSMVKDDPAMGTTPYVAGAGPATEDEAVVVLSLPALRRLGYSLERCPRALRVRAARYKAGKRVDARVVECRVAGVAGDLGRAGIRVALPVVVGLRRFQLDLPQRAGTDNSAALGGIDEIHRIHLVADQPADVPRWFRWAEDEGYRVEAPYLKRGREQQFLTAAAALAVPLLVGLSLLSVWVVFSASMSELRHERQLVGLMRMVGASRTAIWSLYSLRAGLVSLAGAAVGVLGGQLLLVGQVARVFDALALPLAWSPATLLPGLLIPPAALLISQVPIIRAARLRLDSAFGRGEAVG